MVNFDILCNKSLRSFHFNGLLLPIPCWTPSPNFMKANPWCFKLCCWHKEETAGLTGNRQHCWIAVKPAIWIASYTSKVFNSGALSCLTDQQKILHTRLYLSCALGCKTSSCGAKKCWKIAALTKLWILGFPEPTPLPIRSNLACERRPMVYSSTPTFTWIYSPYCLEGWKTPNLTIFLCSTFFSGTS